MLVRAGADPWAPLSAPRRLGRVRTPAASTSSERSRLISTRSARAGRRSQREPSGSSGSTATISLLPSYSFSCSWPPGMRSSPATTSGEVGGALGERAVELLPPLLGKACAVLVLEDDPADAGAVGGADSTTVSPLLPPPSGPHRRCEARRLAPRRSARAPSWTRSSKPRPLRVPAPRPRRRARRPSFAFSSRTSRRNSEITLRFSSPSRARAQRLVDAHHRVLEVEQRVGAVLDLEELQHRLPLTASASSTSPSISF